MLQMFINIFAAALVVSGSMFAATGQGGGVVLEDGLVLELAARPENSVISPDGIRALLHSGEWIQPSADGQAVLNGKAIGTWRNINPDEAGWYRGASLSNAYMYFRYVSDTDEIVLLEANGHEMAYINGVPRSGNPYGNKDEYEDWETKFNYSLIPVRLQAGVNEFLFRCNRRALKVTLHPADQKLHFNGNDMTLPDIRVNHPADTYGAIPIVNASGQPYEGLHIKTWSGNLEPAYHPVRRINPLSVYKAPFRIVLPDVPAEEGSVMLQLELVDRSNTRERSLAATSIEVNVVSEKSSYKETFISVMDGSVQYYGVNPPLGLQTDPALFLSLHGAGVEAINQAKSYGSKNWGYIVAPTNRRPYGYNWENWGRLDALEVLDIARKKYNIDPNRIYLTGHSMGGHGTWHLGINYPDRFAALGPSAGWISIWGYRIRPQSFTTDTGKMLIRSARQSDTYAFAPNLKQTGVYVIHGADDDNVPAEQSRSMIATIAPFHKDYVYHEEPGAGHWWDNSEGGGADCVDWMPMFDYFARRSVPGPGRIRMIEFITANPAVSSKNHWVEIIQQKEQQQMSRIEIHVDTDTRTFSGETENIAMLSIDTGMLYGDMPLNVTLDGQTISGIGMPADSVLYFQIGANTWRQSGIYEKTQKYPGRTGNFREILNHNVAFVYGTRGTAEENAWAVESARFDAEAIWYQGNGAIEVIPDSSFDAELYRDRNILLFGNAQTNSAWNSLLSGSPVRVERDKITIEGVDYSGTDLACLMIRPRSDSSIASVGVVSGTGITGMKYAGLAPYHHPYVGLPDIVVYDSDILESDDAGIRFIGYFGNDWSVSGGELVRRER